MNSELCWVCLVIIVMVCCLANMAYGQDTVKPGATTLPTDEWAVAGGNAARTFQGKGLAAETKPALVWKTEVLSVREMTLTDGFLIRDVVANQEMAFVVGGRSLPQPLRGISVQDAIVALRLSDGERLWMFEAGDLRGSAVGVDGNTLFTASDGTVRAIDCRRGKWIWEQNKVNPSRRNSSDILFDNQKVYVSLWGGKVVALDRKDGKVLWRSSGLSSEEESEELRPWLALGGDKLFLAAGSLTVVRAISVRDGREVWSRKLPALTTMTRDQIDTNTGPILGKPRQLTHESAPSVRPCVAGHLLIIPGWFGLGGNEDPPYLIAMDVESGQTVWKTDLNAGALIGGLASDGKRVYLGLATGKVACLGMKSGEKLWEADLAPKNGRPAVGNPAPWASPVVVNGNTILVNTQPGVMHGLDPIIGRKQWSYELPVPADPGDRIIISGGRIIVTNGAKIVALGPLEPSKKSGD